MAALEHPVSPGAECLEAAAYGRHVEGEAREGEAAGDGSYNGLSGFCVSETLVWNDWLLTGVFILAIAYSWFYQDAAIVKE